MDIIFIGFPQWYFLTWCVCFFVFSSPSNFGSCFHNYFFLKKIKWHTASSCHSYTFTALTTSLSVEPWEGKSSGHRFPMKLSLVGPASSHNPSIPWASVSVYKEGLWDCEACEKTNRPTFRLSRDPALQNRLQADIFTGYLQELQSGGSNQQASEQSLHHPGLVQLLTLPCSCSEEIKSVDVAVEMLKVCDVNGQCWARRHSV